MSDYLCFTIRFLQQSCHGRGDSGEPEWPPSPLRLFQALIAAAAGHWNERCRLTYADPALRWLEQQPPPVIIAPRARSSTVKCRVYVPDNSADLTAKKWKNGDLNAAASRTEKVVRPMLMADESVHYLYRLDAPCPHQETLAAAARSITHIGWGIDMAVGNATVISADDAAKLVGETWRPGADQVGSTVRVPSAGSLDDLSRKHEAFLQRLTGESFQPVPPLTEFKAIHYRRAEDAPSRPFVAFSLLKPDASGYRPVDAARRCRDVAGWVRHATARACEGWPFGDTAGFVHGHQGPDQPLKGNRADERFMYLPLPSIERRGDRSHHVGAIRRVLITAPTGFRDRIDWLRRRLPGQELQWNDRPMGLLNLLPTSDWVLSRYLRPAFVWSTVTPVVWPGHDDRDPRKAEALLCKSFIQAGLPPELVAQIADLDWRPVGYRPGLELAQHYTRPDHMTGLVHHVRVRFPHPVPGPLAVGAGRYRGFGVFANEE